MTNPALPADAVLSLKDRLHGYPWLQGVRIEGIGPLAVIVILTTDLLEAQGFIDLVGGTWKGYPIRARSAPG